MPDEKVYEEKLTKALADAFIAQDNAKKYMIVMPKMHGAKAAVCKRISDLLHISTTQAEEYINMRNGRFKPGKQLSYCRDEQLKQAFDYLEITVTEYNKIPKFSNLAEANSIADVKLRTAKYAQAEIIKLFGEKKANEIFKRAVITAQKQTNVVIHNKAF